MPSCFRYSLLGANFTRLCDVIDYVTNRFDISQFLVVVYLNRSCISCRFKIFASKYNWITILTFWGHLMSRDHSTPHTISYSCSIVNKPISPAIFEILGRKDNWVTTLTFQGHVTSSVTWPLDSPYPISYSYSIVTNPYLRPFSRYWPPKTIGSRPWLF